VKLEICIDVDDVDRAVEFYARGLGLAVAEHQRDWAQLRLGEQVFWIMKIAAGPSGPVTRDYRRHWTPVHLDFLVDDVDEAVARALAAGGRLDREISRQREPGNTRADVANLSDPAGNGVDLVRRCG
jgi:catechol 2,3-dioxygenase-like lactoylglutathione lyase family enzyme